jgi:hypothetical protein
MSVSGVVCDVCGCWYSTAMRKAGDNCGDLSANQDAPCPGICRPRGELPPKKKTSLPVDPAVMRKLEAMARELFRMLDEATGGDLRPPNPKYGMALFLFSFGAKGELTYISNASRPEMMKMLAEFIAANPPALTWDEQHG